MSTPPHTNPPRSPGAPDGQHLESVDQYLQNRQAFQIHAAVYAAGMVGIFLVNLFTNIAAGITGQWSAWWSAYALVGWGLGVAVHGFVVWLSRPARDPMPAAGQGGEAR